MHSHRDADARGALQKELQEKLAQRGLPKSGNKAQLAQRLQAALAEEQEMVLQDQTEAQDELQRQFQESLLSPSSRCAHPVNSVTELGHLHASPCHALHRDWRPCPYSVKRITAAARQPGC